MPRRKATPLKRPITSWEKAPEFMDVEYASLLLGLPQQSVRRFARNGDIPAIKVGPRFWRFEKTALKAWAGVKE